MIYFEFLDNILFLSIEKCLWYCLLIVADYDLLSSICVEGKTCIPWFIWYISWSPTAGPTARASYERVSLEVAWWVFFSLFFLFSLSLSLAFNTVILYKICHDTLC